MANLFMNKLKAYIAVLLPLFAGTILCLIGTKYVRVETGRYLYTFLGWNLFLAWLPVLFSFLMDVAADQKTWRRSWKAVFILGTGVLWLLFYPNAAYLITDLIHPVAQYRKPPDISMKNDMMFWVHILSFFLAAVIGILLSYFSLYTVHRLVQRSYGKVTGWIFAICIMLLSSFGIYVGRFIRWNSWDMITHPLYLVREIIAMLTSAEELRYIVWFCSMICSCTLLGYVFLVLFLNMKRDNMLD